MSWQPRNPDLRFPFHDDDGDSDDDLYGPAFSPVLPVSTPSDENNPEVRSRAGSVDEATWLEWYETHNGEHEIQRQESHVSGLRRRLNEIVPTVPGPDRQIMRGTSGSQANRPWRSSAVVTNPPISAGVARITTRPAETILGRNAIRLNSNQNYATASAAAPSPSVSANTFQRTSTLIANFAHRIWQTEQSIQTALGISNLELDDPLIPGGQPEPITEPVYRNQPATWKTHHEYFLWSCRGTTHIITDHMQAIYQFSPPLELSFVRAKLSNNAKRQYEFLETYLPGETHSMQRAEARIILREAGLTDPDVQDGKQPMEIRQYRITDSRYQKPRLPCGGSNWMRMHDAYLLLFMGQEPSVLMQRCPWLFTSQPTANFVTVRMAQLPFINLTAEEIIPAISNWKRSSQAPWINMNEILI